MSTRVPYYVTKKNVFTWLTVIALCASIAFKIYNLTNTSNARGYLLWIDFILPVVADALMLIIVLFDGKNHIYRVGFPVFLIALYFFLNFHESHTSILFNFIAAIACAACAYIYARIIDGKEKKNIPMGILIIVGIVVTIVVNKITWMKVGIGFNNPYVFDVLQLMAGLMLLCSLQIYTDDEFHPSWGDRNDGRRLRSLDPIAIVANYIMPNRNGSSNMIIDELETTEIDKFIAERRKEGLKGFGITHVFIAAYVRMVAKYPGLNRFLSGQRIYSRGDDIQFCMVVKEEMSLEGNETVIKCHFKPSDTVIDVYNKMNAAIEEAKHPSKDGNGVDVTARVLTFIPGLVLKFAIWFLKMMDYFGLIPKFLLEISPFHASIFLTSMGSLGIKPVVHHLYDFGNIPVFACMGAKRTAMDFDEEGNQIKRHYVDYSFNTDERIVDGFYYAAVLKDIKRTLAHPERLMEAPEVVKRDVE